QETVQRARRAREPCRHSLCGRRGRDGPDRPGLIRARRLRAAPCEDGSPPVAQAPAAPRSRMSPLRGPRSAATDLATDGAPGLAGRGRLAVRERRVPAGPYLSRRVSILQRVRRLLENEATRARILLRFA